MQKIKLGTRGSKLALWQANAIKDMLEAVGLSVEIVVIETKGDKILDRSLSKIGSKGLFTEELEEQLLNGSIDIVQHSAKDLQANLPDELEIIAFTKRETPNDVLVSFEPNCKLTELADFIIGTSSTRRVATLKNLFPNIKTVDMRGNLQTRFRKLEEGNANAMILAYAGVHRMGYDKQITQILDLEDFTPAVGQGSIALESAKNLDSNLKAIIRNACNDLPTECCLLAERAFLKTLQGGCSIPVFAYAQNVADQEINISGGIISLDGKSKIKHSLIGKNPEYLGNQLAEYILNAGGDKILAEIKNTLNG